MNYTGATQERAVREVKWANMLIGISSALIICLAIGVGLYFLLKFHRKKILAGLNIGTEGGIVTTFGALNPGSDHAKQLGDKDQNTYDQL